MGNCFDVGSRSAHIGCLTRDDQRLDHLSSDDTGVPLPVCGMTINKRECDVFVVDEFVLKADVIKRPDAVEKLEIRGALCCFMFPQDTHERRDADTPGDKEDRLSL